MKKCCRCKTEKAFDSFGKNRSAKDGLSFECKDCTREYRIWNRANNGDAVRKADNARFHDPKRKASMARYRNSAKGKAAIAKAHVNWRSEHPLKYKASTAVGNALASGKLVRQPCFICGERRVEGHHPDYDQPLSVVWLCLAHHRETHVLALSLKEAAQ